MKTSRINIKTICLYGLLVLLSITILLPFFMDGILIIKNQPGSVLCSHEVAARRTGMGEFPGDLDKDSAAYVF